MDKRFALITLWLVFASAAVGVGFGAAGLIDAPFTGAAGAIDDAFGSTAPGVGGSPTDSVTLPATPPDRSSTPSSAPRGSTPGRTQTRPGTSTKTSAPAPQPRAQQPVERSRVTSGGSVFARCRGGLVSISVSPAVGWELDDIDSGPDPRARVRFEHSENDAEVEVEVRCAGGSPAFEVRERGPDGDEPDEPDD